MASQLTLTRRQTVWIVPLVLAMTWFALPRSLRNLIVPVAHAATFTVTNTNDDGPGSFRQAIVASNLNMGPSANVISFNIPGSGIQTIKLNSAPPTVTAAVTIDGTTQPGFSGTPLIELDEQTLTLGRPDGDVPPDPNANGLDITAGNSTVRGLRFSRFSGAAISIRTNGNNVIQGNYIGVDGPNSIAMGVTSSNNTIGGTTPSARNVISNNPFSGIMISGTNNVVQGNFIGTDVTGAISKGNAVGIEIDGNNNLIGGTATGAGNVISGNGFAGVYITSNGNVVQSNRIGTDAAGNAALGNGDGINITGNINSGANNSIKHNLISGNTGQGVYLRGASQGTSLIGNLIGVNASATAALANRLGVLIASPNNVIGLAGAASSDMNIIAGNTTDGIVISESNNLVRGNLIGNNAVTAIPNGHDGILISRSGNTIGGTSSFSANVISGNGTNGIELTSVNAVGNQIMSNLIGVDGTTFLRPLPNGDHGILATVSASNNTIGGANTISSTPYNVIAYNKKDGVRIDKGVDNKIIQNYIHDNEGTGIFINFDGGATSVLGNRVFNSGGLAIDLEPIGVTPNDPGDVDGGANGLQNFPLLTAAAASQGKAFIRGTLNSKPNSTYRLEFFVNNACDGSGNGEASGFIGFTSVTTDGSGNAIFQFASGNGTDAAIVGQVASATATDSAGNTSELSPCFPVQDAGNFSFASFETTVSETAGSAALTVGRSGNRSGSASVEYATSSGTATAGADYTAVSGTLNFADGEAQKTITIPITNDSLAEGVELFHVDLSNPMGGPQLALSTMNVIIDDDEIPSSNVYVLTTGNELLRFNTARGGPTPLSAVQINGEKILAIDFRPATGQLYGLGLSGHLFTIDKNTGSLTQVGTAVISALPEFTGFGFDFNPVSDRLRVAIYDNRNLQMNPDTGAISVDGTLAFANGDANAGVDPTIFGLANSNNFAGATTTTTFAINWTDAFFPTKLVTLGSANGIPISPNSGQLFTVGTTGAATADFAGFDISDGGEGFVTLAHPDALNGTSLFKVNLTTGVATRIAFIDSANRTARDIAIEPAQRVQFKAPLYSVNENGGTVTITLRRNGGASGAVSVNYATSNGTATAGLDYTASNGTITFADGETNKTFTIPLLDDSTIEGVESVNLSLTSVSGVVVGPQSTALLAIMDDSAEPGTNPIDNADFFVRQHYSDFLNRTPDSGGLAFWTNHITECFNDPACVDDRRIGTSAAFFIENEFQQTGFFIYRFYQGALARRPTFAEFTADRGQVIGGANLEAGKQAFATSFVQRQVFLDKYPLTMDGPTFVDAVIVTAGQASGLMDLSTRRAALLAQYNAGTNQTDSRVRVMRTLIDDSAFAAALYNPAFVLMQYFGYLRRPPDQAGYNFWLDHLNNRNPNNYRAMVCAFITSHEYQRRFSSIITRSDHDCPP